MIAQSLVKEKSTHLFNGSFGEKWFHYTSRLCSGATAVQFSPEEKLPWRLGGTGGELICITQNETSNGTQVSSSLLSKIRTQNPNALVAVDATSSMGGIRLPFASGDVWFASVQKCFGLPAGLAVLVVSPRAQERVRLLGESSHYNSLSLVDSMASRFQTSCTPNVLGIYLLGAIMKQVPSIEIVHQQTVSRYEAWMDFFAASDRLTPLVRNASVRSHTVITINGEPEYLIRVKQQAACAGFLLGEGYGSLKSSTFRIANFPALQSGEINKLRKFLKPWL
jgi:phosphoserine aminotransferase